MKLLASAEYLWVFCTTSLRSAHSACLTFHGAVRHSGPAQAVGLEVANQAGDVFAVASMENDGVLVKAKRLEVQASAAFVLALCCSIASSQVPFLSDPVKFD